MTGGTSYGIKLVFFRGTSYSLLIYIKSFGIELKYSPLHCQIIHTNEKYFNEIFISQSMTQE